MNTDEKEIFLAALTGILANPSCEYWKDHEQEAAMQAARGIAAHAKAWHYGT